MKNPFDPGYFSEVDLKDAGFKSLGKNIQIAKNCTIIGLENISIGDNVRIDGYCSIIAAGSGYVRLGSFIHIGGYCLLSAGGGIVMDDFTCLSQGVHIHSRSDDYSGTNLTNPTVPEKYTGVVHGEVRLSKHVLIGSGSVVLPCVTIGEGSSIGAISLVNKSLGSWAIYAGCPVKKIKDRSMNLLVLERHLLQEIERGTIIT